MKMKIFKLLLILLIIMEEKNQKKKVTCDNCGYSWETESKLIYVSCPSCLKKVKIKKEEENAEGR